jgi:hypothetical protein
MTDEDERAVKSLGPLVLSFWRNFWLYLRGVASQLKTRQELCAEIFQGVEHVVRQLCVVSIRKYSSSWKVISQELSRPHHSSSPACPRAKGIAVKPCDEDHAAHESAERTIGRSSLTGM